MGVTVLLDAVTVFRLLDLSVLLRLGHPVFATCSSIAFLWLYAKHRRPKARVAHPRSMAVGNVLGKDWIVGNLIPVDILQAFLLQNGEEKSGHGSVVARRHACNGVAWLILADSGCSFSTSTSDDSTRQPVERGAKGGKGSI